MKLLGTGSDLRLLVRPVRSAVQPIARRAAAANSLDNEVAPQGDNGRRGDNWSLRLARVALLGQIAWLMAFSWVQFHRGALTRDFSTYNQGTWLIAHGHIDPYSTVMGFPLWRNNSEFILWPLSAVTYLPPEGLWLLWAQDAAVVATGWIAISWVAEFLSSESSGAWTNAGVLLAGVLWVSNLQVYATAAFDFHTEVFAACFAVLAGRNLWRGTTGRAWIWLVLLLLSGLVAVLYAVALGAVVLLARSGRDRPRVARRVGVVILLVALSWMLMLLLVHGDVGSELVQKYGYLAVGRAKPGIYQIVVGAISHPSQVVGHLWFNRHNLWANIAPSGLLGILCPWGLAMGAFATLPGALAAGNVFAAAAFQNFPCFAFVIFGTVVVLDGVGGARRAKWLGSVLAGVVGVSAGVWGFMAVPNYPSYWLAVSPKASRTLATVRALVPSGAEVVTSQGISGWFSSRGDVWVVMGLPDEIVVKRREVYFVLSSSVGLQTMSSSNTMALETWLERRGVAVLVDRDGISLLRLEVAGGPGSMLLPGVRSVCAAAGATARGAGGCYSNE